MYQLTETSVLSQLLHESKNHKNQMVSRIFTDVTLYLQNRKKSEQRLHMYDPGRLFQLRPYKLTYRLWRAYDNPKSDTQHYTQAQTTNAVITVMFCHCLGFTLMCWTTIKEETIPLFHLFHSFCEFFFCPLSRPVIYKQPVYLWATGRIFWYKIDNIDSISVYIHYHQLPKH